MRLDVTYRGGSRGEEDHVSPQLRELLQQAVQPTQPPPPGQGVSPDQELPAQGQGFLQEPTSIQLQYEHFLPPTLHELASSSHRNSLVQVREERRGSESDGEPLDLVKYDRSISDITEDDTESKESDAEAGESPVIPVQQQNRLEWLRGQREMGRRGGEETQQQENPLFMLADAAEQRSVGRPSYIF